MVNVTGVLCPVDFSDTSNQALARALVIAGWYGAPVTILHVRPDGDVVISGSTTNQVIRRATCPVLSVRR